MVASPGAPFLSRFWLGLGCLTALLLTAGPVSAVTLTFDRDGNSANGITETSGGVWNTTDLRWFSSTEIADIAWPNTTGDTAIFGAGGGTSSATTLSVGTAGNLNVNNIIFNYLATNGSYILASGGHLMFGGTTPTVTVNSNTASINARMTATSFTKDGAGILVINNAQNSLGAVTVNAGVLDIFTALTATDVVIASGARFDTHSGTTWTMDSLTYNGTGNSNMTSLGNGSVSNYTVGAGGLTMNAGTITVNAGTNVASNARSTLTINGPLNFSGGTINISTSNVAGNEVAEAKVLLRNNINVTGTATIGSAGLGSETLDLDGGIRTVTVAAGTNLVFNLNAVTANGGLIKDGAGTMKIGGAQSNTYTGMTTVTAGILSLGKTGGATAVLGDITVNGGILDWDAANQINDGSTLFLNGGTLRFEGYGETLKNLTITGGNVNDGGGSNGGFVTITDTLSATGGSATISLNSGGQWTVNKLVLAATFNPAGSEIALNGNSPRLSLFTVGSGGMTINGHAFSIEKAPAANPTNAGSEFAIYGDVTATGTNTFTYGTGNTSGVSQVNLGNGIRTWNIVSGTTTINSTVVSLTAGDGTVAPVRTVVDGGLIKTGTGTLVLTADNAYIGKTTVNQGILRLANNGAFTTGGIRDSSWLQVDAGATFDNATGTFVHYDGILSGTGTLSGTGGYLIDDDVGSVLSSGSIRPGGSSNPALISAAGDQTGTLTFAGPLQLAPGAVRAQLQIIGATGNAASSYTGGSVAAWIAAIGTNHASLVNGSTTGAHDQIRLTGGGAAGALTLNADGTIEVVAPNGYVPSFGDVFNLFDWASLVNNGFDAGTNNRSGGTGGGDLSLPDLSAYPGYLWDVSQFLNSGIVVVVPEPGRMMLFLLGLGSVMLRRRRK